MIRESDRLLPWRTRLEPSSPAPRLEVEELTPDGGRHRAAGNGAEPRPTGEPRHAEPADPPPREPPARRRARMVDDDDEPTEAGLVRPQGPELPRGYDPRRPRRRVKIQGLQRYFGRIVVPTEKITEIRNNKKRIVERKTYPGYIMVEMELNEKTWFTVRETPGVGDFVGAHGTPTKMTEAEVNQMLGQRGAAKAEDAPKVRIDVERGDRVKIKDGPFENFEGTVEEVIEARGLVKVMLIIFNRPTPVDLEYWQVERI